MILCVGTTPALQRSMTFDRITANSTNRAIRCRQYASGKSINVARVAHTLGHEVLAVGFLGGLTGQLIRQDLAAAGIPHDFMEVTPSTRTCVTAMDASAGTATELVEESAAVDPPAYEQLLVKIEMAISRASCLVLSGSLPPGAPMDFYARCVKLAEPGIPVVLDARGPELMAALATGPSVVKPNRDELAPTVGGEQSDQAAILAAMQKLLDRGAKSVIVTAGSEAVLCAQGRSAWRIRPPRVRVVSPVGSGDAMAAGLAIALIDGRELADAAKFGVVCGAANAMTSDAGHIDPADARGLTNQVRAEAI